MAPLRLPAKPALCDQNNRQDMLRQIKQCAVAISGLAARALAFAPLAAEIDQAGLVVQSA